MEHPSKLVIRVYALIVNDKNEVLLSDEYQLDMRMTKFPGGGMEAGEGPLDCIVREIEEECEGQSLLNVEHFYTTDYFQKALFMKDHQLISIYYKAELKEPVQFEITETPFAFEADVNGNQSFRWKSIRELVPMELTFPIDRKVAALLRDQYLV